MGNGLEQKEDFIEGRWREVDSDYSYRDDMKEGLRFDDIIVSFKKSRSKKTTTKGSAVIATIWRLINWFIVWRILCTLITFLFEDTLVGILAYVLPGIPWVGALKMISFFFALNVALNASKETNKDDFRFATAVALSAIPTILMMFSGRMGLFNLFIAGCLCFSIYREKIYTDAKVRRTPPKKKRRELHRTEDGGLIFDEYDV